MDAGFLALATDVENKMLNYSSGLASAMPAAGVDGRVYRQTDTHLLFFDDGAAWHLMPIAGAPLALNAASGVTSAATGTLYGNEVRLSGNFAIAGSKTIGSSLGSVPAALIPVSTVRSMAMTRSSTSGTVTVIVSPGTGNIACTSTALSTEGIYFDGASYFL